ncbi:hypothetical protein [Serinibacter salmoneus]|uniref:Uncharacterized protein n=1 Tax=Serinibacter salmoneus TaxID=556530 RepID=A0A2A9D0E7_9MICO|nr:hypothetical protein [Serinibacter salmoneus]PFG19856.1 hypothetical protein ATL40_1432 [Serinibacter salmoneus]
MDTQFVARVVEPAARRGLRVLVVLDVLAEVRPAMDAIAEVTGGDHWLPAPSLVRRGYGQERIEWENGGSVSFASLRTPAGRSMVADVVAVVPSVLIRPDRLADLIPCTVTSRVQEWMVLPGPLAASDVAALAER